MSSPARGAVVVTGASTGIGCAAALHLAAAGFHVYAGVRREPDAESLRREGGVRVEPILLDVCDREGLTTAAKTVAAQVGDAGLAGLVNNAGIGVGGPLEFLPLDELRRVLEVNTVGAVATTQTFLPLLRAGRGRVVFVSSVSGLLAAPFAGPYAASKFALEALADSLRVELAPWSIAVSIVEPGDIQTPIWEKTQRYADEMLAGLPAEAKSLYGEAAERVRARLEESARGAAPVEVTSRAIAHALTARRPRTRYLVGANAKTIAFVARFVPDRIRDRVVERVLAG